MQIRVSVTVLFAVLLLGSPVLADFSDLFCCHYTRDTFGDAFRSARDNQILNPNAAGNLDPVEGLNGQAANLIYEKYLFGFEKGLKEGETIQHIDSNQNINQSGGGEGGMPLSIGVGR
jgi:hypothetical protein